MGKNNKKNNVKITSIDSGKILAAVALGALILVPKYYDYEYKGELWCPAYVHEDDLIVGEDGESYYYFEAGKHFIEVARNDFFHHEIEKVDGYEIRSVEVDGWKHSNVVIYVNTEPVMVKLTGGNDVFSYFDEFGTVVSEDEDQKVLEKKGY